MKMTKRVLTVVVLVAVILVVLATRFFMAVNVLNSAGKQFRSKGNPQAKVKVIEYMDYQCPACGKAAAIANDLLAKYPEKVFLEVRYFPLPRHGLAKTASVYAECAGQQGYFWPMHKVLFKTREIWEKMASPEEYYHQLAVSVGVRAEELSSCVQSAEPTLAIEKDLQSGKLRGVNSLPAFFVNDRMIVGGSDFMREIEALVGEGK